MATARASLCFCTGAKRESYEAGECSGAWRLQPHLVLIASAIAKQLMAGRRRSRPAGDRKAQSKRGETICSFFEESSTIYILCAPLPEHFLCHTQRTSAAHCPPKAVTAERWLGDAPPLRTSRDCCAGKRSQAARSHPAHLQRDADTGAAQPSQPIDTLHPAVPACGDRGVLEIAPGRGTPNGAEGNRCSEGERHEAVIYVDDVPFQVTYR